MGDQPAIVTAGLTLRSESARALDGIDPGQPAGTEPGMIGPNGGARDDQSALVALLARFARW